METIKARDEAYKILKGKDIIDKAVIKAAVVRLQNVTSLPRNKARSVIGSVVRQMMLTSGETS